jgi:proteasome lid subunit RPN8/RPN11
VLFDPEEVTENGQGLKPLVSVAMFRFARLVIPDLLLEEVVAHARAEAPRECCGLLAGHVRDGVGVVTARYPIENAARSTTEYETDARGMFFAFRKMRESEIELLAIYHSHPTSAPIPSRPDIAHNTYGESVVHLIVSLAATQPEARAWWLGESGYREVELRTG